MKRLYILILALVGILSVQAQTQDNAMYVYRNDGSFNAFFIEDIDSIMLSHFNADSIYNEDVVSQIYYTQDSIYCIPIAAIDSVSFVQPEIKFNPDVKFLNNEIRENLIKADEMTLVFNSALQTSLNKLNKGDILVYLNFDDPIIDGGFVGRITNLSYKDNVIVAECDSLDDVCDIFEQFIAIDEICADKNRTSVRYAPTKSDTNFTTEPFGFNISKTFELGNYGRLGINFDASWKAVGVYKITPLEKDITITICQKTGADVDLSLDANIHESKKSWPLPAKAAVHFPLQLPIFEVRLSPYFFFKGSGNVKFGAKLPRIERTNYYTIRYNNNNSEGTSKSDPSPAKWNLECKPELSIKGEAHTGIWLQFYIGTIKFFKKWYCGTSLDAYIGPKVSGELSLDVSKLASTNFYDFIKDSKITLTPIAVDVSFSDMYSYKFDSDEPESGHTFFNVSFDFFKTDFYLFPDFTEINIERNKKNSFTFNTTPSRNVLFPQTLGFGVYKDNKLKSSIYNDITYKIFDYHNKYSLTFDNLEEGRYKVRPVINLLGIKDIQASPEKPFNNYRVDISNFYVTKSQFRNKGFEFEGNMYSYKFDTSVSFELMDLEEIEDWGYVYRDPDGNEEKISLKSFGTYFNDTRYVYYRNSPESTAILFGYVKYLNDDTYYYDSPQSFDLIYETSKCVGDNHPHKVDLGLPSGTMWACTNLYANVPEDAGWYFAWAETTPKEHYTPDWYAGYGTDFPDIAGMSIDAATANWGQNWRMPTQAQMQELIDECTWQWTTLNGKTGYLITGPNGNTIFLPGGGMMYDTTIVYETRGNGYYWTSTPGDRRDNAYGLNFDSGKRECKTFGRYGGRNIRPVYVSEQ